MNAIEIKKLTKDYKDVKAVDNLDLVIKSGELFSLLGVNGAGKTTTIKMLSCITTPTSGDAFILGKSIIKDCNEVKKVISVSPQETAVSNKLSVIENLDFIASIYNIKNKDNKINSIMKELGLTNVKKKYPSKLSGGYQRRLSIAMSLISEPSVLFLDEPTLGLDVIARRELWNEIRSLKKKKTIILTTHYMEEAEILSDRIGIMKDGKLLIVDTPKNIIKKYKVKNMEDAFIKATMGE